MLTCWIVINRCLSCLYLSANCNWTQHVSPCGYEFCTLCRVRPCFVLFLICFDVDFLWLLLFWFRPPWCWLWCTERLVALRSLFMLVLMYVMLYYCFTNWVFFELVVIVSIIGFSILMFGLMVMVWDLDVSDIDVWFYTAKNLLAPCSLLWPYRLPEGYSFCGSLHTGCRFLVWFSLCYTNPNIDPSTFKHELWCLICSMAFSGDLQDLWT